MKYVSDMEWLTLFRQRNSIAQIAELHQININPPSSHHQNSDIEIISKFDSTESIGAYNCYVKIPQCKYMEHGLKDIASYGQKHITTWAVCYNFPLISDKPLGRPHLWDSSTSFRQPNSISAVIPAWHYIGVADIKMLSNGVLIASLPI